MYKNRFAALFAGILLLAVINIAYADEDTACLNATPKQMQWWRDARFGMFVHWGPVSLRGTEISWSRGRYAGRGLESGGGQIPVEEYDNLYKQFNPIKFNADEWVRTAKAAGAKYLVFTTKHHDGFCEFDSKYTDYKITNSPYGKDIVAQLAEACHKQGLKIGFYYSPPDFHHPDYFTKNHARYIEYMHNQLRELCTNYGKVSIIWFDGLYCTAEDLDSAGMIKMIRELQPGIIINNRSGLPADYDTPEQTIGGFQNTRPWESCITIGDQWAYKPNDNIKSLKQCIQTLVRCACGDGNLLLNVGPNPLGEIEPLQVQRLKDMGAWLNKYGESIYGTRGGPYILGQVGGSTRKGNNIYVHVLDRQDKVLTLPAIPAKVISCKALTGGTITYIQDDNGIRISIKEDAHSEIDTIIVLELDRPASEIEPVRQTNK